MILELNKPVQIVGIDIGNEYSAYVSVMVGRKGSAQDQDFKVNGGFFLKKKIGKMIMR